MLVFVKMGPNGGIWANPEEALGYMEKGCKVYTDVDETTEVTKKELEDAVDYDSRESSSSTVAVAAGAEG